MASVEVTVADLQSRWEGGNLTDQFENGYLEQQIEDAVDDADTRWSALIESRLTTGALKPGRYKRIIADAVFRVIRNPEGFTSENNAGYGYGKNAQVASGALWFTAGDIALLTGETGAAAPGTFGIGIDRGWR